MDRGIEVIEYPPYVFFTWFLQIKGPAAAAACQMVLELPWAGLNFQSSERNQNEGISHTTYLALCVCPSVPRYYSSRTYESIQSHCVARPKCGSSGLHTYLPTRSHPVWCHYHLDQNFHPICHPISPIHHPLNAQPICQCILCCHRARHMFHPTWEGHSKLNSRGAQAKNKLLIPLLLDEIIRKTYSFTHNTNSFQASHVTCAYIKFLGRVLEQRKDLE